MFFTALFWLAIAFGLSFTGINPIFTVTALILANMWLVGDSIVMKLTS